MEQEKKYSWAEQMVVVLARDLKDDDVLGVGGARHEIPFAAVMLAKKLNYCPNMTVFSTGAAVNAELTPLQYSGHTSGMFAKGGDYRSDCYDTFQNVEHGRYKVWFYNGLQIDKFGNCNLHFIGDPKNPTVRGPGVANVSFSVTTERWYLFPTRHNKRTFVDRVDFITLVGFIDGGDSRQKLGIKGGGPKLCVTPLGVFDFEEKSKRMRIKSKHEWVNLDEIIDNTGFELIIPDPIPITEPPRPDEMWALRNEIDPMGILRGEGPVL